MQLTDQKFFVVLIRWSLLSLVLVAVVGLFIPVTISTNQIEQSSEIDLSKYSVEAFSTTSSVIVANVSDDVIQLAPPTTKYPEIFNSEQLATLAGYSESCNCIELSSGHKTSISGIFGDMTLQILSNNSGDLKITRVQNDSFQEFTETAHGQFIEIPSLVHSMWRTTNLYQVLTENIPAVQGRVEIFTPNHSVQLLDPVNSRLAPAVAGISFMEIGNSVWLWVTLLGSIFLLWGLGKFLLLPTKAKGKQAVSTLSWIGFLVIALPLSLLSYFASITNSAIWIASAVIVFIFISVIRNFKYIFTKRSLIFESFSSVGIPIKAVAVTALSFPAAVFFGSGFFGDYKTDFYDYTNQSALMRTSSLPEIWLMKSNESPQSMDALFGWNLRSIDTAMASAISILTHNTNQALTFLALLIFALGVLSAINIFSKISNGKQPNILLLLLLVSAPLSGLFVESYFSQFVFVIGLFALVDAFLGYQSKTPAGGKFIYFALINAFLLCVYPYFWFVAIISLVLTALITNGWRWFIDKQHLLLVGVITLLVSTSWIPALTFQQTNIYNDSLNKIAIYTLLSPFDTTQALSLGLGGLSYEWRQESSAPTGGLGFLGEIIRRAAQTLYREPWIGISIVGLAIGILAITLITRWREIYSKKDALPLLLMFSAFGVAGIYFGAQGGTYASLKFFWTAAAVFPLLIISIAALIPNKISTILVPAMLVPLFFTVNIANSSYWFSNLNGVSSSRSHVNAIRDVNQFRDYLETQEPSSLIFIDGTQTLQGSDRDRVLLNQLNAAAKDSDIEFQNCIGRKRAGCQFDASSTIITIGKTDKLSGYSADPRNVNFLRISLYHQSN